MEQELRYSAPKGRGLTAEEIIHILKDVPPGCQPKVFTRWGGRIKEIIVKENEKP